MRPEQVSTPDLELCTARSATLENARVLGLLPGPSPTPAAPAPGPGCALASEQAPAGLFRSLFTPRHPRGGSRSPAFKKQVFQSPTRGGARGRHPWVGRWWRLSSGWFCLRVSICAQCLVSLETPGLQRKEAGCTPEAPPLSSPRRPPGLPSVATCSSRACFSHMVPRASPVGWDTARRPPLSGRASFLLAWCF